MAGIFIDDKTGENSVIVHPGASAQLSMNDFNSQKSKMQKGDIFLTQFEQSSDTTFSVLKEARKLGMITIFNPAPFGKINKKVYQSCEIITPNETEAEQITNIPLKGKRDVDKAINKIRDLGVEKVIITPIVSKQVFDSETSFSIRLKQGENGASPIFGFNADGPAVVGDVASPELVGGKERFRCQ